MTESKRQPSYATSTSPVHGVLAEFDDVTTLTRACESVRDAGYTKWDAHTPFPVHGLDAAMGVKATRLPWAVLGMAICGLSFGLWLQCWTMGIDYKFIISGKPFFSIPAFIPVTFELTVLFSALTVFFGSLALNNLPELFHPLNLVPQFRRVTDDRFCVYVEAKDPKFNAEQVAGLLNKFTPLSMEQVRYATQGTHTHLPSGSVGVAAILAIVSVVPFALFARAREKTSLLPRIHANPPAPIKDDMDKQYKHKAQSVNWFFADGRAMRNWPGGTVAEEDPVEDTAFWSGRHAPAADASVPTAPEVPHPAEGLHKHGRKNGHAAVQPSQSKEATQVSSKVDTLPSVPMPPVTPSVPEQPNYVTQIPADVVLNATTMARGQQRFNIYCSTCHGYSGQGDGQVHRHAEALQEGTWVAPSNLHEERVRNLAVGDLYNTVAHGVRNMPGYGHIIEPMDRWLIVAYVKALQRSQHAAQKDVPSDEQRNLH